MGQCARPEMTMRLHSRDSKGRVQKRDRLRVCTGGALRRGAHEGSWKSCCQCLSGYLLTNPSRLGIRTLGKVSAFITSLSPMILFNARMYAVTA